MTSYYNLVRKENNKIFEKFAFFVIKNFRFFFLLFIRFDLDDGRRKTRTRKKKTLIF